MEKRNWFVDINSFEPMLNGATAIVRESKNDNNGTNDGIMIIGLNQVNAQVNGGLSFKDAYLISACPDLLQALTDILIFGLNKNTILAANKSINKAHGFFDED